MYNNIKNNVNYWYHFSVKYLVTENLFPVYELKI